MFDWVMGAFRLGLKLWAQGAGGAWCVDWLRGHGVELASIVQVSRFLRSTSVFGIRVDRFACCQGWHH